MPGGPGRDHRGLADQRELRPRPGQTSAAVDRRRGWVAGGGHYLAFADAFESTFVHQGGERRALTDSLDLGWQLLAGFPDEELKRIPTEQLARFRPSTHRPARLGPG